MSSEETVRPARARAPRAEAEQTRRRRRDPNDNGILKRLAVPTHKLDPQRQYRWVNDSPGRINMLERQDWDLVTDEELGEGYTASRHADVAPSRVPITARLMSKPKDFYEEDHAVRLKRIDDEMKAAELGQKVLNGTDSEGLKAGDARVYTPNLESNKL